MRKHLVVFFLLLQALCALERQPTGISPPVRWTAVGQAPRVCESGGPG